MFGFVYLVFVCLTIALFALLVLGLLYLRVVCLWLDWRWFVYVGFGSFLGFTCYMIGRRCLTAWLLVVAFCFTGLFLLELIASCDVYLFAWTLLSVCLVVCCVGLV